MLHRRNAGTYGKRTEGNTATATNASYKAGEFGGSADFENRLPLLKDVHSKVITPWWSGQ